MSMQEITCQNIRDRYFKRYRRYFNRYNRYFKNNARQGASRTGFKPISPICCFGLDRYIVPVYNLNHGGANYLRYRV